MPTINNNSSAIAPLTVGSVNTGGSAYYPWPQPWNQQVAPRVVSYPVYVPTSTEEYANEVEVTRGEHDATLRFYRSRARSKTLVKEITVPLGVLAWLTKEA